LGKGGESIRGRIEKLMKIVVCVRTLNEEKNIRRFMESYQWADKILVADSGSWDRTVEIAREYDNASVYHFTEKVYGKGYSRPPHGKHINALLRKAIYQDDADWVIFDDCDCVPNYLLRLNGRNLLENLIGNDVVFAYRMYMYGDGMWFPDMSIPGQSLWAWRSDSCIWASEIDPLKHELLNVPKVGEMLDFPYTLMHYFAPDEETIQKKLAFYNKYKPQESAHPLDFCGKPEPLPEWARI